MDTLNKTMLGCNVIVMEASRLCTEEFRHLFKDSHTLTRYGFALRVRLTSQSFTPEHDHG